MLVIVPRCSFTTYKWQNLLKSDVNVKSFIKSTICVMHRAAADIVQIQETSRLTRSLGFGNRAAVQMKQVSVRGHPSLSVYSLEDGDEEVEQKDVGEQQIDTQHDDGQPFWEGRYVFIVQHGTFGLQRIGAVHTTAAHIKLSVWITKYRNTGLYFD